MDVQRTDVARQKKRKRTLLIGVALAAVILISIGLAQLEPAAPTVEGGALYFSNVERGEMLRQVRGPGTLVPESLQWITAATQGRVERILVLPGTVVEADTVLLELSRTLKPRGVLFCSNPRGNNEEGLSGDRYSCFFDLDTWRNFVTTAGFLELQHYFRPPGLPRHKQPWLATVWRKG